MAEESVYGPIDLRREKLMGDLGATCAKSQMDPWQHRSNRMRCRTCMWFVVKAAGLDENPKSPTPLGRCRRHAPSSNGFVPVFANDWCGDHRLDENKI